MALITKGAPLLPPMMEAVIHPAAESRGDGWWEGGGGWWEVCAGFGGVRVKGVWVVIVRLGETKALAEASSSTERKDRKGW